MIAADQFLYNDVEQGLSPDGRFLGFTETASTSGALALVVVDLRGKATVRLPWADMWLSSTELLLWSGGRVAPLKAIPLVGGKVREVLPAAYAIGTPAWAPDGRRFAVVSDYQRGANADGSHLRTIAVPASEGRVVWSPDGRWIAMTERPWFGARAQLLGLGITAVDVVNGRTQRLRTNVSQDIANVRWTSDSKHVLYDHSPSDGPSVGNPRVFRPVIRQVGLDGSDAVVRALPSGGGGAGLAFISDTSVIVANDSTTYVRSLTSDAFVSLWQGRRASSASQRGDLIAVTLPPDADERTRRTADILTAAGVHVAKVTFPTALLRVPGGSFLFTPDNKSLLAWGRSEAAKGCCVLYQAPLDGGPVRTLTEFANSEGVPPFALSPDGTTLLFAPPGSTWTTFWSIDVSGLLRGAPRN
jgi:Tol biopolymer transport system component